MRRSRPLSLLAIVAVGATLVSGVPSALGQEPPAPSVRLYTADHTITLPRYGERVPLNLGVVVAATEGNFELHVTRPDYQSPIQVTQVDAATDEVLRTIPSHLVANWRGLKRFIRVRFLDGSGSVVAARGFLFCPNSYRRQRVDDEGPARSTYPEYCGGSRFPFFKGMIWGIDDHWATDPLSGGDYGAPSVKVPPGDYTVQVAVTSAYRELFDISGSDGIVTLSAHVRDATRRDYYAARRDADPDAPRTAYAAVPTTTEPDPGTVPDLVALPAWAMRTYRTRHQDRLSFATTLWNAGPAPLMVEGFRRPEEDVMDAFQYFTDSDGNVVARAPAGTMEYDTRRGHDHWHFNQFARFTLLDKNQVKVVRSRKQSFCLFPTDAVDLTVGSQWNPWNFGGGSVCGRSDSIWIREQLDAGWGDTYYQSAAGQAFNITNVPNGWYWVKVQVNPTGELYEASTANNVELRQIYLGGRPRARTVIAVPWQGIEA